MKGATVKQSLAIRALVAPREKMNSSTARALGYKHESQMRDALSTVAGARAAFIRAMDLQGDDIEELAKILHGGLHATLDGGLPDYKIRGEYLDRAIKVRGLFAPEKVAIEGEVKLTLESRLHELEARNAMVIDVLPKRAPVMIIDEEGGKI